MYFSALFNLACGTEITHVILTKKKERERERERERNHFTKLADFSKNFKQPQIYVVVDKM